MLRFQLAKQDDNDDPAESLVSSCIRYLKYNTPSQLVFCDNMILRSQMEADMDMVVGL
jgi:hypothetical protein